MEKCLFSLSTVGNNNNLREHDIPPFMLHNLRYADASPAKRLPGKSLFFVRNIYISKGSFILHLYIFTLKMEDARQESLLI